jgi:hypothetical protein
MSYSIKSKNENDCLILTVSGDRTPENIIKIVQDFIQITIKQNRSKVLIDVRELIGRLTIYQSYNLIVNLIKRFRGQSPVNKLAILDQEVNRSRYRFFETVARNRGINLKAFFQFSKAMEWLV